MSSLSDLFDVYALRARLYPAFLCVLPVLAYVFVLLGKPDGVELWMPFAGSLGLLFFLANVVRSRGKKREATLVETWGGMPTTLLLRHRTPGNQPLRERRRRRLEAVIGEPLPTEADEQYSPAAADDQYVTAVRVLISRVRDAADKHPRVHEENINYGFRRNLLALKTPALVILVLALGADVAIGVLADQWIKAAVLGGIHLLALTAWPVVVTAGWVRETADSYAERLFDALEDPTLAAS